MRFRFRERYYSDCFFWVINNCVRNEGKVKPQIWTPLVTGKNR